MKKLFYLLLAGMIILSLPGCSDDDNNEKEELKTIQNLKDAIKGETEAMTKYAAYSKAAGEEGLLNIKNLFKATSRAEEIHIQNHQRVLKSMNVSYEPEIPTVTPESTNKNLQSGIEGETYESSVMYPGFIKEAQNEMNEDATKTFTYALKAEEKHASLYKSSLEELTAGENDDEIPSIWHICPRCGDVYHDISNLDRCETCGQNTSSFEKVG